MKWKVIVVHSIFWMCGFHTVKCGSDGKIVVALPVVKIYTCLLMAVTVWAGVNRLLEVYGSYDDETAVVKGVYMMISISYSLTSVSTWFSDSWLYYKQHTAVYRIYSEVDKLLSVGAVSKFHMINRELNLCLVYIVTAMTAQILDLYRVGIEWSYLSQILIITSIDIMMIKMMIVVEYNIRRLSILNIRLRAIVDMNKRNAPWKMIFDVHCQRWRTGDEEIIPGIDDTDLTSIHDLMKAYDLLKNNVDIIAKTFRFTVCFTALTTFLTVIIMAHELFSSEHTSEAGVLDVVSTVVWGGRLFLITAIVAYTGEKMLTESGWTLTLIAKSIATIGNDSEKYHLTKVFSHLVVRRKLRIYISSIINLDFAFLHSFVGISASYVIIVYQIGVNK